MGFRDDFLWGAASAAFQIEGGYDADGKGPSIWDVLSKHPSRIAHGEVGDIACDHYHRFREDIAIMKAIGLKSYRFSVSWPRILPQGTGEINEAGIQFYIDLIDALNEAGIEPLMTLYHWDLPYALYLKGGWKNSAVSDWFAEYTSILVDRLGDKVKYWLTFNEPQMFVSLGFKIGIHAPFESVTDDEVMSITKNILLAHGKAVKVIRAKLGDNVKVGLAPTGDCHLPKDDSAEAVAVAKENTFSLNNYIMSNAWWADPIFLGKYPEGAAEMFGDKLYTMKDEEWETVSQPLDFYAFNVYQATNIMPPPTDRYSLYGFAGAPKTSFGWDITPSVLYWAPVFFYERYGMPILITENGYSGLDWPTMDGKIHDFDRIDFLHRYLLELKRAINDGVDVIGYTTWSFMDNLEWASGFDVRFGLVFVDFRTGERIIKDSGEWYRDVILSKGENL